MKQHNEVDTVYDLAMYRLSTADDELKSACILLETCKN